MRKVACALLATLGTVCLTTMNCSLFDFDKLLEQDPTKTRMEGIWEVTEAYNTRGESILDSINFPITLFQLSSNQGFQSTAGPMTTYLVYGGSKYATIASKIDQVFDYAKIQPDYGSWFIQGGQVTRFTIEMTLEGIPGQSALTNLLGWLGIGGDYLDVVIYHKFIGVKVTFDDFIDTVMTWEFDETTEAEYNIRDKTSGDYQPWTEWSTNNFSHCKFVLTKRVKSIQDLIRDAQK